MKTEDLIAALAADTRPATTPFRKGLMTLGLALALVAAAVAGLWHVRPDLAQALQGPALLKTLTPALLAVLALGLVRALARPEDEGWRVWAPVLALLGAFGLALGYSVMRGGLLDTVAALDIKRALTCLISVPILSLPPLAALLWSMRAGAPAHPARAGAIGGLVAGASAAALYSLHCPEDTLLFFTLVYSVPVLAMTGLGGVLGARLLRW